MGCEVQVYLEFWHKEKGCWISIYPDRPAKDVSDEDRWRTEEWGLYSTFPSDVEELAFSQTPERDRPEPHRASYWYFGRNYSAFGYLAGVRGEGPAFEQERGIPEDASKSVKREYWLRIVETEDENGDGCTTRARAKSWVTGQNAERYCELDGVEYVAESDWHSASHYTLSELSAHLRLNGDDTNIPKRIFELRDEMVRMSDRYVVSSNEIRVVFWFDN